MLTEGRKKNICLFHRIMKVQNVKLLYYIPIMEILKIYLDDTLKDLTLYDNPLDL